MPIEEIKRPLSLPPKNWNIDIGLGPEYYHGKDTNFFYPAGNINFIYPYLPITDKMELHFTLLNLKYYMIKNVAVSDSTLVVTGPNWTIGGGLKGFSFSPDYGVSASFDLFSELKHPLSEKVWTELKGFTAYTPVLGTTTFQEKNRFTLFGGIILGFQWNKHVYSTIDLSCYFYHVEYFNFIRGIGWTATTTTSFDNGQVRFGSTTGYIFNKNWKIYICPEVFYFSNLNIAGGTLFGAAFNW